MGARFISPQGVLSFLGVRARVLCCKLLSSEPEAEVRIAPRTLGPMSPPAPLPLLAGLPPSLLEGPKSFPGD